ncbi:four helix bundle protein [Candidatus Uhrbacteria bacterium]|nr:four helix bundle protein [Candidatus Uhrbacteria bacterium]
MQEKIVDFTQLEAWRLTHQIMLEVYEFVKLLPADEKYNRVPQLRRCSSSTPANIAEGFGRFHYQENIQFCRQARGSLEETRNHIIAARDLHQAPLEACEQLIAQYLAARKVLNGYIHYLLERRKDSTTQ